MGWAHKPNCGDLTERVQSPSQLQAQLDHLCFSRQESSNRKRLSICKNATRQPLVDMQKQADDIETSSFFFFFFLTE